MKRFLLTFALSLVLATSFLATFISAAPLAQNEPKTKSETYIFTQMLNKNYVYGDDFTDDEKLIENSMISLLPKSDNGRINKNEVKNFILDFYGITMNENAYNRNYVKNNYYYYIPKGYDTQSHQIVSVVKEDDYYYVTSVLTLGTHENESEHLNVKSVFLKNSKASFGYNLINCEIEK